MSDLPFPEAASTDTPYDEPAITSEQLLRKEVAQRFGSSGTYRDLPFAVLFLLQLCTVIVIALVNGLTLGQSSPSFWTYARRSNRSSSASLAMPIAALAHAIHL